MAVLKGVSRSKRSESLTGKVMVDSVRGVLRVRKWPKKRGTPTSAEQLYWIDWFRQANKLAKYVDGATAARAIELTAGSGMYPRDIILSAMRGRLYSWYDASGKKWRSMAAVQDISDSLDILEQDVGSLLIRYSDRWRGLEPGVLNEALLFKGEDVPPEWGVPVAAITQRQLAESPISPAGTVSSYVFDVSAYATVQFLLKIVDLSVSDTIKMQLSTDGGVSYKSGALDYLTMYCSSAAEATAFGSRFDISDGAGAADHMAVVNLSSLQAPRMNWQGMVGRLLTTTANRAGFAEFPGPITHVKLFTAGGANFSAGTILAMGTLL